MLPVLGILFLMFLVLFKFLPNRKANLLSQVPGALITAASWIIFSYLFSFYFEIFPGFSNMYGSLTALIIVMLWIYFLMNLMLYGAEINTYFEKDFMTAKKNMKERRKLRKRKKDAGAAEAEKSLDSRE